MELEALLPAELRGPDTKIARVAAGQSGAGVYRVDAGGKAYVLKVGADARAVQMAAEAGLAPRVVHVDGNAVVSEFVEDRSFGMWFMTAREPAVEALGKMLARVHALPVVGEAKDPRAVIAERWAAVSDAPPWVGEAVRRVLGDTPAEAPRVMSHNDVNPTNLVYDGSRVLLLDWDAAGPNDPLYDLAAIAMFFRMDDATCRHLLAAHDGAPVAELPARFAALRRTIAVMCGVAFLSMGRATGGDGGTLVEFYGRMRAGAVSVATPEGRWEFGLALAREGA
jgi:aminoglycoside phosphotransferase